MDSHYGQSFQFFITMSTLCGLSLGTQISDILEGALPKTVEENRSYLCLFMKMKSTPEDDLMFNVY